MFWIPILETMGGVGVMDSKKFEIIFEIDY